MIKFTAFTVTFISLLTFPTQSTSSGEDIVGLSPLLRTVNNILTAPMKNQARLARNRARMRHRHLLKADNPLAPDEPIIEDYREEPNVSNDGLKPKSHERMSKKNNKNNKRDEEYYLWSINNWVPYGRSADTIAIDDIYEYNKGMQGEMPKMDVKLLANPSFYRNYEVLPTKEKVTNIIPKKMPFDRVPVIQISPRENSIFPPVVPKMCCARGNFNQEICAYQLEVDDLEDSKNINAVPKSCCITHDQETYINQFMIDDLENSKKNDVVPKSFARTNNQETYLNQPKVLFNTKEHYRSADPRHFHSHHHSTTFKNLFSNDKSQSGSWNFKKQPQIVINNHNINTQVAQTAGYSTTTQNQLVAQNTEINRGFLDHGSTSEGKTSLPIQLLTPTNNQMAKTFYGSTTNQVQIVPSSSGGNNQFSLTSDGSKTTQSQLVGLRRNTKEHGRFNRRKRSLPLVRLITDPNAKLDMPRTLENVGTVARNSFQDKRHPMHHMTNMMGSARDVFLSALRVPPQGIVIPSQYRIVDVQKDAVVPLGDYTNIVQKVQNLPANNKYTDVNVVAQQTVKGKLQERLNSLRNNLGPKVRPRNVFMDDKFNVVNGQKNDEQFTFQRMGNIIKNSIESGQQTLSHITDVAHSARKALATATLGAPRVVRPFLRAAAFQNKDPERVTFVAPRFLDVTNDGRQREAAQDDFVDVADIMNAFGVSNPNGRTVGLRRYVVHSSTTEDSPIVGNRFAEGNGLIKDTPIKKNYFIVTEDIEENEVADDEDIVKDLTDVIGVDSLKELLNGMKTYVEHKSIDEQLTKINEENHTTVKNKRQTFPNPHHHRDLTLPPILLRPFMGSPSAHELNDYFRQFGDEEVLQSQHEYIGAINPKQFQKMFNEPLQIRDKYPLLDGKQAEDMVKNGNVVEEEDDDSGNTGRISMKVKEKLLRPYMGNNDKNNMYVDRYIDYVPDFGYLPNYYDQHRGDIINGNRQDDRFLLNDYFLN